MSAGATLFAACLGGSIAAAASHLLWARRRGHLAGRPALGLGEAIALVAPAAALAAWLSPFGWTPPVRFDEPMATALAPLVAVFVAHRLATFRKNGKLSRHGFDVLSMGAALLAALAVAGPEIGRPLDRMAVIVAIDRSRSLELVPNVDSRLDEERRVLETTMRDGDRLAVVVFGAAAKMEQPLLPRSGLAGLGRIEVPRDGTDIAAAIRLGLSIAPPDALGRIVVLSDGVSTRGRPLDAAAAARVAGIPVDVVPLDQAPLADVRAVALRGPSTVTEGEALDLGFVTRSPAAQEVEVRLLRDGALLRSGRTRIAAGEDVIRLRERAAEPGLHRYEAQITALDPAADRLAEDNAASLFVRVSGAATALVLDEPREHGEPLRSALEAAGFLVETGDALSFPADLGSLAAYDLVALGDIPARRLDASQLDALGAYVEQLGGGLLLMGGDQALGPGGYGKTPVERVSPVSFDLKQDRRRASLAEVIIIDFSGSMAASAGKHTKLALANEAAARSIELLGKGDRVGVAHVDTEVHWTVPLTPADDPKALSTRVRHVQPGGGGIFVDLALEGGFRALGGESVGLRHLLLFSDGSDAEEKEGSPALVRSAAERGITTSVVALGRGDDVAALEELSRLGHGRFYVIDDASRLPAVFAQETIAASRSAIVDEPFVPKVAGAGRALEGVDFSAMPPLGGYVVTIPKDRATVSLTGPEADPLLATWRAGVGQAGAFTSDYKGRWGKSWLDWPEAARLFGQLGRQLSRRAGDSGVTASAHTDSGELRLRARARDPSTGRSDSFRHLTARIAGPAGAEAPVDLAPTGPGLYEGRLPVDRPGAYVVSIVDSKQGELVATTGATLELSDELTPTGTNRALLEAIAHTSGGKVRATLADVFSDREGSRRAFQSIAPLLTALAGFLLVLGVAARRLSWPDGWTAMALGRLRRLVPRRAAPRPARRGSSTAQSLAEAKARRRAAAREAREARVAPIPAPPRPDSSPADPGRGSSAAPSGSAPPVAPDSTRDSLRKKTAAEIVLERRRRRKQ